MKLVFFLFLSLWGLFSCNTPNASEEQKNVIKEKNSPKKSKYPHTIVIKNAEEKEIATLDFLTEYQIKINYGDTIILEYERTNNRGAKKYFNKKYGLQYPLVFYYDGLQIRDKAENLNKILWTVKYQTENLSGKSDSLRKEIFANSSIRLYQGEIADSSKGNQNYKLQKDNTGSLQVLKQNKLIQTLQFKEGKIYDSERKLLFSSSSDRLPWIYGLLAIDEVPMIEKIIIIAEMHLKQL